MAQRFPPFADTIARSVLIAIVVVPFAAIGLAYWFATSNYMTSQSITLDQPVPFSHQHHVGGLGIDCRYCHTAVTQSTMAGIPPTHTCMTCHSQLYTNARMLAPVRESLADQRPIHWNKVNRLPEYVYFDHSIHVAKGVGCATCHGPVDRMPLMRQAAPLTMGWCLDCRRDPAPNLRPEQAIFDPEWSAPADQAAQGQMLAAHYHINSAHLTDCSVCHRTPGKAAIYGALALGWRGAARHWRAYETLHLALACLGGPLVVSLHSVVGMDFAASLMPGWQETIFPPYFVVGPMYSGFAMVVCLAALVRWGFRMPALITPAHFDVMAKVMLTAALIMGLSYATEWFNAWYGGERAERSLVAFEFTGSYAPLYYMMLLFNVVVPQAFWIASVRSSIAAVFVIAVLINVGMWLERILIVWNTLSHDYMPSAWRLFLPTVWDWLMTIGSLGLFALMFLVFVRLIPAVSMHETRRLATGEEQ